MASSAQSDPVIRHGRIIRIGLSALTGLLLCAAFPKINWPYEVWISGVPLLLATVSERRAGLGFLYGMAAGTVFLAGSCYWLATVMEVYGGLGAMLSAGVLVLFVLVFAPIYGVFGAVESAVARRSQTLALILGPFLWVALELARTYFLTGFPWNLLGYAVRSPGLQQIATVTAVYGLSFVVVVTWSLATWVFLGLRRSRRWMALAGWIAMLVTASAVMGPPKLPPGPDTAILLQPDIPLKGPGYALWIPWQNPAKLDAAVRLTTTAAERSPATSPRLLIWPEDPAPFYFDRDPIFRHAMEGMARAAKASVIAGTTTFRGTGPNAPPRNSAVVLDPSGKLLMRYDKIHLVPFGEYVPWWGFPGKVGKITNQVGDFIPGRAVKVARTPDGAIGIFICYEDVFPQLVRQFTRRGAQALVSISDDGWYGNSSARYQHMEMARFRAIENRRFLLRDTNDGLTAVIDPYGRIVARIEPFQETTLTARYGLETEETFYTRYGDVFAWTVTAMAGLIVAIGLLRKKKTTS